MRKREVTELLGAVRQGENEAFRELLSRVYGELRTLASAQLRRERADHTLQPTALVHEAYMQLVDQRERRWETRAHFLSIAALAMRRVLVSHAVRRNTLKRGGGAEREELDEALAVIEDRAVDILALDETLTKLAAIDEQKARIVELRFFGGLTTAEIAENLGVSTRTVERGWEFARVWLKKHVELE